MTDKSNHLVRVFVYGTLKPGESNYQQYCSSKVLEAKRAIAFGKLYHLSLGYPAMTLGKHPIQGFLLSFSNDDILPQLDWLEDYDQNRPAKYNHYNRCQIEIYHSNLTPLGLAWVYLMTQEQVDLLNGVLLLNGWWSGCGITIDAEILNVG